MSVSIGASRTTGDDGIFTGTQGDVSEYIAAALRETSSCNTDFYIKWLDRISKDPEVLSELSPGEIAALEAAKASAHKTANGVPLGSELRSPGFHNEITTYVTCVVYWSVWQISGHTLHFQAEATS